MPKTERFHIMQVSTKTQQADIKADEDVRDALNRDPDAVCFSELQHDDTAASVREICRNKGYHFWHATDDTAVATKQEGRDIRFKDGGYVRVHPGQSKPENQGGTYGERGVSWARISFYGVDTYIHTAHWAHNQTDDVTGSSLRRARMMSNEVAKLVRKHGKKGSIAFFTGDMNVDPDQQIYPHDIFTRNKLVTIWEDAEQRPTHGNRSIDVIGRYGADKRVKFVRFETHRGNSDHRQVSAWYDIRVDKFAPQDQPPGPSQDDDDGPVFTAGNRSWKDYTDQELYDLPQATDRSDTENG